MPTLESISSMISVEELRSMLANHDRITVLDIRTASDRAEWSIPGSLHIDAYDSLKAGDPEALAGVELPQGVPVVTVCSAGLTSQIAARQLSDLGYLAQSLEGGMNAWSLAWNTADVAISGSAATVIQIRRTGKGCLSYLVGSEGQALVIDASLDPEVYVELAREHGWSIIRVADTHIHADHLSSSRALVELTGATHHLPAQQRALFSFAPLFDGETMEVGNVLIGAIATPGHTPESMVFALDTHAIFTGDTLFLSAVGRPDLEASAEEANARARLLYHSIGKLASLPQGMLVLPGHTDRPVPFDGQPVAMTLGEVVAHIEALQRSEDDFVDYLIERIPPAPPNHSTIFALNEAGALPGDDRVELEAGANRCAVS